MTGKKRLLWLMAVLTAVSMVIVGIALTLLYIHDLEHQRKHLVNTVESQASLVEAVAKYAQSVTPHLVDENPDYDSFQATLSHLQKTQSTLGFMGETGEFTLARREGDQIVFLLNTRRRNLDVPYRVAISSQMAEPMRRALKGESGTVAGIDYRGEQVLAAYRPLEGFGLGFVAKVDLSEIRAPFIRTGLISGGIALVLIVCGVLVAFRIGSPMILDLVQNEALLNTITTTMPGCVYQSVLHKDGSLSIPYLSDAIEDLTGIKAIDLTKDARLLHNYVHPDDHASLDKSVRLSAKTLTPWDHEFRVVTAAKGTIWLTGRSNPTLLPDGDILWNGVLMDITERKRAEEELRDSEETHRGLIESLPQRIFHKDANLVYVSCNGHFARDMGIEPDEIAGKTDFDFYPRELAEKYREEDRRVMASGQTEAIDESSIKNGQELWVHTVKSPVTDDSGVVTGILGIFWDITERKQAEEALRASEEKFRKYIAAAPDGIFVADAEGRFVEVNQAACELTGYTAAELTSMAILDIIDADTHAEVLESFRSLKVTGGHRTEFKLKRKDGSIIWSSLNAVALSEDRFMAFCSDITETKRLQTLESRAERLETAGTIAGQVAHDFNNLLAPLMAYPDFIREDLPKDHPALAYIDDIENSAKQIAEINQQLLTLGRRGHYNQKALNMNTIVSQAIRELSPLPKTLTIETELEKNLLNFKGGGSQIHRILSNLLSNAMEAMQDIGRILIKTESHYANDVAIAYGRVPKGEYIKLTISDTGCGIPDDILQRVFDPFFTSKTTDKKRGSGLGLSVVDAVVKDHKGYLDLTTKVGVGTSFYLYFPVSREDTEADEAESLAGGAEKVLIVDDDEIQREVSQRVLAKLGYKVSSVDSGEKAIELLREYPQDIVILDMVMPGGIDGAETYRRMLEVSPQQKAIILSGYSESGRVLEAQKLGAGAFVKKPVTRGTIAAAVRKELERVVSVAS